MTDEYWVENCFGDRIEFFPYTVQGLHDAAELLYRREQDPRTSGGRIININRVDLDRPSGLTQAEEEYLECVWGL